jgi:SAM-dependent methyltransferase
MTYNYDELFFDYIERGVISSARRILPALQRELCIGSVLDVGCGRGLWLAEWRHLGVTVTTGVDGAYVDRERIAIPVDCFVALDLSDFFDLGKTFDLVQCLEVGEHISPGKSKQLVANLVHHGRLILFSAATKGQGGEFHINERSLDFWRGLFEEYDFLPFDYIRPLFRKDGRVEPWYRYNTILYIHTSAFSELSPNILRRQIPQSVSIPAATSLLWSTRCALLRQLPESLVTKIARYKHKVSVFRDRIATNRI